MKITFHFLPFLFVLSVAGCYGVPNESDSDFELKAAQRDTLQSALSNSETNTPNDSSIDTLRYLALGDSYTIGQSVDPSLRWPVQLRNILNENAPDIFVEYPDIIAQTGWTTSNLSNAMDEAEVDDLQYDVVSLLIGVNNQYQGLSLAEYEIEYAELLERAINIAGGDPSNVFVVSIPDYGYTPFGQPNQENISADLVLFNESCQSITEAANVTWYNITPISQQWPEVDNLVASDNLHPSGFQYGLWVDSFWENLMVQLASE